MGNTLGLIWADRESAQYLAWDVLFYPAVRWIADALSDAGAGQIRVIMPDGALPVASDAAFCKQALCRSELAETFAREQGSAGAFLIWKVAPGILAQTLKRAKEACPDRGIAFLAAPFGAPFGAYLSPEAAAAWIKGNDVSPDGLLHMGEGHAANVETGREEGAILSCPVSLHSAAAYLRERINFAHMKNGVFMLDAAACSISPEAVVAPGAAVLPGCMIKGESRVGAGSVIGPDTLLENAHIGQNTKVNASQIYNSRVGDRATIGPYAHVRPQCVVGDGDRIGNFVELKNAKLGEGTKVSHLTYIGDAVVGSRVNFGCGTVTVNYDGGGKYITTVEDDVFIGCNANLMAPVTIGEGAYVAAGSTITDDVPPGALAIARERQTNKENWAREKSPVLKKKKE